MSDPTITVRLSPEKRQRLTEYAAQARKSRSAVLVEALDEYLARRDRAQHTDAMNRELKRLAKLEREDPDLAEFYGERGNDPSGDPW
ncbi:MAG: ribbon-helix-helix domain-containing protein [Nitrococcus sp.]|nr:ribbon-helix-helix domain-containing protein [Nitrococcus sp.]